MYNLFEHLARTKKFGLHPRAYYEALFEELQEHPENGTLVLGYIDTEEKPISFVLVLHVGTEAYHLYSATSAKGYEHNVPTLALYTALKEGKEHGATRYNLGGTTSMSSQSIGDFSAFKKKFGGERIEHPLSMDIVVSGWRYAIFRFLRLRTILATRRLVMRLYKMIEVELNAE